MVIPLTRSPEFLDNGSGMVSHRARDVVAADIWVGIADRVATIARNHFDRHDLPVFHVRVTLLRWISGQIPEPFWHQIA